MSRSPLTEADIQFLRLIADRQSEAVREVVGVLANHDPITSEQADLLRDAIMTELMRTGVDAPSGSINERGKRLDSLIDKIEPL